jgi:hypothetical protein
LKSNEINSLKQAKAIPRTSCGSVVEKLSYNPKKETHKKSLNEMEVMIILIIYPPRN